MVAPKNWRRAYDRLDVAALRDFWFPIALTASGFVPAFIASNATDNARRVWWSLAAALWFVAVLAYIWGDPVRGPFARLAHPRAREKFFLHAGGTHAFPIADLRDGIEFSRVIRPEPPLSMRISRRWLSGMQYEIGINKQTIITNDKVAGLPIGWDINHDDSAVEVVAEGGIPLLQVVQDGEYDVWINVVMTNRASTVIMSGDRLTIKPTAQLTPDDYPPPLFKYPSYMHRGVRR